METLLKDHPQWIIDKEPIENAGRVAPVTKLPESQPLPQPVATAPVALDPSLPAPQPLPEGAARMVQSGELPEPEPGLPADMINMYRDRDFEYMTDPEGSNWYGRDDELIGDVLKKWVGNSPLAGMRGLATGFLKESGVGDVTFVKQISDAMERFKTAPDYVQSSPEGIEYRKYLSDRMYELLNPVELGASEAADLFATAVVDAPKETLTGLARAIVDDPLLVLGATKLYGKAAKLGEGFAMGSRFNKLLLKLGKVSAEGKAAAVILKNATRIAPVVMAEGVYAAGYEAMNNVMRGSPITSNVKSMGQLGAVLGGAVRGVGMAKEAYTGLPYGGKYKGRVAPHKTTVPERMAELNDKIGGSIKRGAVRREADSTGGQISLLGIPTKAEAIIAMNKSKQAAIDKEYWASRNAQRTPLLKGSVADYLKMLHSTIGSEFRLKNLGGGWSIKTGFTDRSKGSGLVNFDNKSKTITVDTPRFVADPVGMFKSYVTPDTNTAFGRTYRAAADEIGFKLDELTKLLPTSEDKLRFAVAKEKHYIQSHSPIPKKTGASVVYRNARNMYRHEESLYKALEEVGYDVSTLKKPGKWRPTKVKVSEKVSKILNSIKNQTEAVSDIYKTKLDEVTTVPYNKRDPIAVNAAGEVSPNVRAATTADRVIAAGATLEDVTAKVMPKGKSGMQFEMGLDTLRTHGAKGLSMGKYSKILTMLNRNKMGAMRAMLGHRPSSGIAPLDKGLDEIDDWMGNNAIMDRHAMSLQHRVKTKIPDATRREAIYHQLEHNLDEYNNYREAMGEPAIKLTDAELTYADTTLAPMLAKIYEWADAKGLIARDPLTGKQRYRHGYVPHIPVTDFKNNFESYISELMERGKSAVSMKANASYKRTYKTAMDAITDGAPVETDIAKVLSTYTRGMWRVESNRGLVDKMKTTGVGQNKLVMTSDAAPDFYKEIKHPVFLDEAGEYMKVDPALFEDLKIVFDTSDPSTLRRVLVNLNTISKRLQVGLSMFHAVMLGQSALFAGLNPLKGRQKYKSALSRLREGPMGDDIDGYLRAGLQIGGVDDVNSQGLLHLMEASSASVDRMAPPRLFGKIAKAIPDTIKNVTTWVDAATWDYSMTLGKIISMDNAYSKLVRADITNRKATGMPLRPTSELANEAAIFTNDAFGGLDWARMGRTAERNVGHKLATYMGSKHGRETLQLLAFAPDWTAANFRILYKAIPGAAKNGPMASLYRGYFARAAAIDLIISEGLQQANTGTSIFDNEGSRGWLRPTIGDGIHLSISKQFTEVPNYLTRMAEGDFSTVGHKSSSLLHVLHNIARGRTPNETLYAAVTPFTLQTFKREGELGAAAALGIPATDYDKEWTDR